MSISNISAIEVQVPMQVVVYPLCSEVDCKDVEVRIVIMKHNLSISLSVLVAYT